MKLVPSRLARAFSRRPGGSSLGTNPAALPGPPPAHVVEVEPGWGDLDVASHEVLRSAPVWMSRAERLLLYALAFSLRPRRYLEIGTLEGGSALVVAAALDAARCDGRIVCVDLEHRISPENWRKLEHRTTFVAGSSPQILPRAKEAAGGLFDMILIDGDHTPMGVMRDAAGILPFAADGAYVLFHDSFNPEVALALAQFATSHVDRVLDFGVLTREVTVQREPERAPVYWGGLRLMQVQSGRHVRS